MNRKFFFPIAEGRIAFLSRFVSRRVSPWLQWATSASDSEQVMARLAGRRLGQAAPGQQHGRQHPDSRLEIHCCVSATMQRAARSRPDVLGGLDSIHRQNHLDAPVDSRLLEVADGVRVCSDEPLHLDAAGELRERSALSGEYQARPRGLDFLGSRCARRPGWREIPCRSFGIRTALFSRSSMLRLFDRAFGCEPPLIRLATYRSGSCAVNSVTTKPPERG